MLVENDLRANIDDRRITRYHGSSQLWDCSGLFFGKLFGAHLVHKTLQMECFCATDNTLSDSKQMKRGVYEQGRKIGKPPQCYLNKVEVCSYALRGAYLHVTHDIRQHLEEPDDHKQCGCAEDDYFHHGPPQEVFPAELRKVRTGECGYTDIRVVKASNTYRLRLAHAKLGGPERERRKPDTQRLIRYNLDEAPRSRGTL